jgi:hypothetical protein
MKVSTHIEQTWSPRKVTITFEDQKELNVFLELMARDEVIPKYLMETGYISREQQKDLSSILITLWDKTSSLKYEIKK